jgi:hypothetical protein
MTRQVEQSPFWPKFHCDDCDSDVGFRSRRRTFMEQFILPLFLLKPVRCGECFRRDYRFILVPVKNRLSEASGLQRIAKPPAPSSHNTRNVA